VNQAELAQSVDAAIRSLNPEELAHVAYSIRNDSTDDPAIFFRIVLTDAASREDRLGMLPSVLIRSILPHRELGSHAIFPEWS
jgi:hypothetical protein